MIPTTPLHAWWLALMALLMGLAGQAGQPLATGQVALAVEHSAPTVNDAPLTLRPLTQGGCCTQPSWTPDSRQVLYIDKPTPSSPSGIWSVDATQPGAAPTLYTTRLGSYTPDMAYIVQTSQNRTVVERLADGKRWTIPSDGRSVSLSPGRTLVAWQVSTNSQASQDRRINQIWVANIDGTQPRSVTSVTGGGFNGWITDDLMLFSRREAPGAPIQIYSVFSISQGTTKELFRADRVRDVRLSPGGEWLAYTVSLSADKALNGLWIARTDGSLNRKLDRALFGSYQWRDGNRLLIIPFQLTATYHQLWEHNASTGASYHLTEPSVTPFKIANNDWRVAPNGQWLTFVSTHDRNLWLLTLP